MKKTMKKSQPLSLTSLPDEIIENCLARISRWNYPSLSLVCKKFGSLLSSKELYKTRSQIGTNEIYVCLQFPNHPCPSWFSLWAKHNQTTTRTKGRKKITFKKNSSGNVLVPTPSSSSPSPPLCKKFGSLLSSKELYKTRSQIGTNEIYVCLQFPNHPCPSWFSLWAKHNQTTTRTKGRKKITFKKNSSGNVLVPTPSSSSPSPPLPYNSTIPVGSEIYVIGGAYVNGPSSAVWILDCLSHTWREGPEMTVAREDASANFLDEKIYVMGGGKIDEFANNWMEVFDIKTQSWTAFPCPCDHNQLSKGVIDCVLEGKLHLVADTKEYILEPKEGAWKVVRESWSFQSVDFNVWCVVENVICCCTSTRYCMWYDFEGGKWEMIKGLEELREHRTKGLSNGNLLGMSDRGGKILVMWEPKPKPAPRRSGVERKNEIWYAEISLETSGSEIWGKIEWVDVMLTVHRKPYFELGMCLTVSV